MDSYEEDLKSNCLELVQANDAGVYYLTHDGLIVDILNDQASRVQAIQAAAQRLKRGRYNHIFVKEDSK